jgi:hypothetical protein
MQTESTDSNPEFSTLEASADAVLSARGYQRVAGKDSTAWIDPRSGPPRTAIRFTLCSVPNDLFEVPDSIFFGVRQVWATCLGIAPTAIGPESETVAPSTEVFRGDYVRNIPAGKRKIDSIIQRVQTVYDADGNALETSPVPLRADSGALVVMEVST